MPSKFIEVKVKKGNNIGQNAISQSDFYFFYMYVNCQYHQFLLYPFTN